MTRNEGSERCDIAGFRDRVVGDHKPRNARSLWSLEKPKERTLS